MNAIDMTDEDLRKAAHNMREYGGSFAAQIAEAYFCADAQNANALLKAFGGLFVRYAPHQVWDMTTERKLYDALMVLLRDVGAVAGARVTSLKQATDAAREYESKKGEGK